MRIAYVSGPYRAKTEWGVWQNVWKAREIAAKLWAMGYAVICPHANTSFFGGAYGIPDKRWIEGDLEMLRRLLTAYDCIVMIPDWDKSEGAQRELHLAAELGLNIYYWPDVPKAEE